MREHKDIIAGYYSKVRDELVGFVEWRTGSHELAEDLIHDAFLRLLTSDKMLTEQTLPALVYAIVRNLLTDHFRRLACSNSYAEHLLHTGANVVNAADTASLCSLHEIEAGLERGLAHLPERCREPYRLHILGGLKISDIQRETGEGYKRLEHNLGMARKEMRVYMRRFA